jgi:hypothetical protein
MGFDPTMCQTAGASTPVVIDIVKPERRDAFTFIDIEAQIDYIVVKSPAEIL